MKKHIAFILTFALLLSLLGCEMKAYAADLDTQAQLDDATTVVEEVSDIEAADTNSHLILREIIENGRPYIKWDALPTADKYKVTRKRASEQHASMEIIEDTQVEVFPGETVSYQITPLDYDGKDMPAFESDTLEVHYTAKSSLGGLEDWVRPDGYYTYRSVNEFPDGLYWSAELADEINTWLKELYSTDYLLSGHVAEIDPATGAWVAPMAPDKRLQGEWEGSGLDCVGFVNGFYYLYTQAFAGEDYKQLDREMDESYGVYACPTAPTASLGYSEHIVLKPSLAGGFADKYQIRPGDMVMTRDHAFIVSDQGSGLNSKIWEYEEFNGFSGHRTLTSMHEDNPDHPYDYWLTTIANPLESYGKIIVRSVDEAGNPVTGGSYRLTDLYDRILALEDFGGSVDLYRPDGDTFFNKIFTMDETAEFYDDSASFALEDAETTVSRVIGGEYILEELEAPVGYGPLGSVSISILPGEELVVTLKYTKV